MPPVELSLSNSLHSCAAKDGEERERQPEKVPPQPRPQPRKLVHQESRFVVSCDQNASSASRCLVKAELRSQRVNRLAPESATPLPRAHLPCRGFVDRLERLGMERTLKLQERPPRTKGSPGGKLPSANLAIRSPPRTSRQLPGTPQQSRRRLRTSPCGSPRLAGQPGFAPANGVGCSAWERA